MAFLTVPTFDATDFTRTDDGVLVSEASDLRVRVGALPYSRLYDDAIDEGMALRSPAGTLQHFYLDSVDKDASDEDIYGWRFKPVREIAGITGVLIIND